ncbi:MAG: hypothetical protein Fur0037_15730 [Planctomycetota bacterium]
MSYRKDQGRYARMFAFWALIVLFGYGCFHAGGLVSTLDNFLGESNQTYVEQFPLLGSLKLSTLIAIGVLILSGVVCHKILNRPRIADALIDTEAEMYKVTWPGWSETWQGTLAVAATVLALFLFLTFADIFLMAVLRNLI